MDPKQIKVQGLRYGRTLQTLLRIVAVFSVDHANTIGPMQQSFEMLNALVKQTRSFTFGFVDQRVMLNNVLTDDPNLQSLENEFLKRGIGAVKFEAGISLAGYKKAIALLCTPIKTIEEMGGTKVLLDRNPLEFARIMSAGKNQARSASGDTILETDSESYMAAKQLGGTGGHTFALQGLESLLESVGVDKPESFSGGPSDIMRMVGPTVDAALTDAQGDPQKSHQALATVLENLQPDLVLSAFPAERHEAIRNMPSDQIASELIEDRAVEWAANRLRSAPAGDTSLTVEEDVLRVLARGLKATQGAERMLDKLAKYVERYALPPSIMERIRAEVQWNALPPKQQMERLLETRHFGPADFRHLMDLIKEFLNRSYPAEATALALHYLGATEFPAGELQPDTLSRIPGLLRAMAGVRTEFAPTAAEKLGKALMRDDLSPLLHQLTRNALITLANAIAAYEDYSIIQSLGGTLERSLARDKAQHAECCGGGLQKLLPAASLERMVEMMAQRKEDAAWMKTAAVLFRWAGDEGIERLFQRLEEEKTAGGRMALMRFIAQTGHAGLEVARRRLKDERWYVVRNACQVLGELKDPELLPDLAPALQHSDDRVQKAASDIIIKGRDPARAKVFADALPHLRTHTLEQALDELFFLKNPATLYALQEFIFHDHRAKTKILEKAVHAVTAMPGDAPLEVLSRVLADATLEAPVRKLALHALVRSRSEVSRQLLASFVARFPKDALAAEAQRALGAAGA